MQWTSSVFTASFPHVTITFGTLLGCDVKRASVPYSCTLCSCACMYVCVCVCVCMYVCVCVCDTDSLLVMTKGVSLMLLVIRI